MTLEKKSYFLGESVGEGVGATLPAADFMAVSIAAPVLFLCTTSSSMSSSTSSTNVVALIDSDSDFDTSGTRRLRVRTNQWESPRRQSQDLVMHIDALLKECRITLSDLSALLVHTGPGSFTGVRVALTVGNALAYAAQKPIFGADSFAYVEWMISRELEGKFRARGTYTTLVDDRTIRAELPLVALIPGMKNLYYAGYFEPQIGDRGLLGYRLQQVFNGTEEEIQTHYSSINPLSMRKFEFFDESEMITFFIQRFGNRFSETYNLAAHVVLPQYGAPAHITPKSPSRE